MGLPFRCFSSVEQAGTHPRPIDLCRHTPVLPGSPRLRKLPLRLENAAVASLEGAPQVPEYRFFFRYGDEYNVDLRVDFGGRPTPAMRAAAQRALNALRLPRWPHRC